MEDNRNDKIGTSRIEQDRYVKNRDKISTSRIVDQIVSQNSRPDSKSRMVLKNRFEGTPLPEEPLPLFKEDRIMRLN